MKIMIKIVGKKPHLEEIIQNKNLGVEKEVENCFLRHLHRKMKRGNINLKRTK
jgi:hypothetical protein